MRPKFEASKRRQLGRRHLAAAIGLCASWALLGAGWLGGIAHAHDGDPKATAQLDPYTGPGYRADVPGAGGPAMTFPQSGVVLMAWIPLGEFASGLDNGNDCWGYVSPSGREYAIYGTSHGTGFVEVTTPGNPTVLGFVPGPESLWRDVKTFDQYAYAVSEGGGGVQVIDLTAIDSGTVQLAGTVTTGGDDRSHNVAIDTTSGYLYRTGGGDNGLRIYSLADPALPTWVASWPDRYVHDAMIHTFETGPYAGKQIAFCCSGFDGGWLQSGIDILDVTDKSNIILLSRYEYPSAEYSHQCWLSEDEQYLFLNDEVDELEQSIDTRTHVLDVSDLTQPVEVATFSTGLPSVDHNLYVAGNLVFQANYRSGLRIFDATNPLQPTEIAYFDTYPENDAPEFDGLWSNYPWLPSGTIIGSDIEKGLFVWRLGEPPLAGEFVGGAPTLLDPFGGTEIDVAITEQSGGVLAPDSVLLRLVDEFGTETLLMPTEVSPGLFRFITPALGCGEQVRYTVEATATDGWILDLPREDPVVADVAESTEAFVDDMETDLGWTAGLPSDDATTGAWERADPFGTAAQPEDDHSDPGILCWVTGAGSPGGSLGADDIDGGSTTLVTPLLAATGTPYEAWVSYWRWYSNQLGPADDDVLRIEIANDGGPWIEVEALDVPTDGWERAAVRVSEFVDASQPFRLRFIASDLGSSSLVEAAIDDLSVTWSFCADCDQDGTPDSDELIAGTAFDCNGNGQLDSCDIADGISLDTNGNGIPDECECTPFVRGDANADGGADVSDAVFGLDYLFDSGPQPMPTDRLDINDDGSLDISDVVYLLAFLFQSGAAPPPPFPDPGCDPTM